MKIPKFKIDFEMFIITLCSFTFVLCLIPTEWGVKFMQHKIATLEYFGHHPLHKFLFAVSSSVLYALMAGLRKKRVKICDADLQAQFDRAVCALALDIRQPTHEDLRDLFMRGVNVDQKVFPKWWNSAFTIIKK